MSTPPVGSTIPEPTPPKCPHCKQDMPTVDGYPYTLGAFLILSVSCTKCKTLLHMGIMPLSRIAAEQEAQSPLWKPS
jgi:hypothetical protein